MYFARSGPIGQPVFQVIRFSASGSMSSRVLNLTASVGSKPEATTRDTEKTNPVGSSERTSPLCDENTHQPVMATHCLHPLTWHYTTIHDGTVQAESTF